MLRPELQKLAAVRFELRELCGIFTPLLVHAEWVDELKGFKPRMTDCEQCGGWGHGPDCEEGSGIPFTCYHCGATGRVTVAGAMYGSQLERFREFEVTAKRAALIGRLERARVEFPLFGGRGGDDEYYSPEPEYDHRGRPLLRWPSRPVPAGLGDDEDDIPF